MNTDTAAPSPSRSIPAAVLARYRAVRTREAAEMRAMDGALDALGARAMPERSRERYRRISEAAEQRASRASDDRWALEREWPGIRQAGAGAGSGTRARNANA